MRGLSIPRYDADFAAAIFNPDRPVPAGLAWPDGRALGKRFNVYRNNVVVSLINALRTRFPAVERIVGEEFFAACARVFAMEHPPRSTLMMTYGDGFPAFLSDFDPARELPYLADVARIEAARTRAYHAADAEAPDLRELTELDPDQLFVARLSLHPSVELIRSQFPVVTIWAMNSGEAELEPVDLEQAEDALVARRHDVVLVRRLPPGGAEFLSALLKGNTIGEAAMIGVDASAAFDLTANIAGIIESGILTGAPNSTNQPRNLHP